ncbi:MAG: hypothetical protein M3P96_13930 [Actinomycetota bacterium]|nr:hypothetical protein [Actinomycetota bacterium]
MMAVHVLPAVDSDGSASTPYLVASGRASAIFAVLAGVGLALATGGPTGPPPRTRAAARVAVAVRALAIGALGLAVGYADTGVAVILAYYGVLFLLAVPLLGLEPRMLATLALGAAVTVPVPVPVLSLLVRPALPRPGLDNPTFTSVADDPVAWLAELTLTGYYPALAWTAYLCAGLAAGRLALGSVRDPATLLAGGVTAALLAAGTSALLLGPLGGHEAILTATPRLDPAELDTALQTSLYGNPPATTWWWLAIDAPHASTPLDLVHTTGSALAVLGAALLAGRLVPRLLAPLATAGSMTLTLYTVHVLLPATDVLPDDPEVSYVVQVVAALAVAMWWRQRHADPWRRRSRRWHVARAVR